MSDNYEYHNMWCDHEKMTWTKTDQTVEDAVICKAECPTCGWTDEDFLSIEWGEDRILVNAEGQEFTIRTIKARGNLSECCKCGKLLGFARSLFDINEEDPKASRQMDFCKECFEKVIGYGRIDQGFQLKSSE